MSNSERSPQLPFLKGADMIIYQVAKSLGLDIDLKAICGEEFDSQKYALSKFGPKHEEGCPFESEWCEPVDNSKQEILEHVFDSDVDTVDDICWCFKSNQHESLLLSTTYYGNETNREAYYQNAALLVAIPEFSELRGSVQPTEEEGKGLHLTVINHL